MHHLVLKHRLSHWKVIHWVFLGLGVVAVLLLLGVGALVGTAASALDTDRDLKDFENPQQAREFVSAHLPTPLPDTAVVEELRYERWQDWHLKARIRLGSAEAVAGCLDKVKLGRELNDAYCGDTEASGSVRFFLKKPFACCSAGRATADSLSVTCYTR
jgi:hypothetical protein